MPNNDLFVSAVIPVRDCAPVLPDYVTELAAVMAASYANWEIVLVGDLPDAATEAAVMELLQKQEGLRYLRLSRRSGQQAAVNIGLENAIGDAVAVMSPWNDPPSALPDAVALAVEQKAGVFGRSPDRRARRLLDRLGSRIVHRYCRRRLGHDLPSDHTGFFVLGRRELNALLKIRDNRHPVLLSVYTGYPHVPFDYAPLGRRDERPGLLDRTKLAYDILIAGHLHPLRLVSIVALGLAALNMAYLVYVFAVFFFFPTVSTGWSSLSVQVSVMFLFLFLVLAVLCEYVGRLVRHGLDWPKVFISEERNSSVFEEDDRKNVV